MAAQPQIRMTKEGDRCRTSIRKGKTEDERQDRQNRPRRDVRCGAHQSNCEQSRKRRASLWRHCLP